VGGEGQIREGHNQIGRLDRYGTCMYMHINPHDQVLADVRFRVGEELLIMQAELVIAPAKKGAAQMTSTRIKNSKKVANVRINVEQVVYPISAETHYIPD
jgi:hypothetical protein